VNRRAFITLLGGAAASWPLGARAQQREDTRRIGVLMNTAADDPEGHARIAVFHRGLQEWGWTLSRNARIDVRWGALDAESSRRYAAELVALAPEVILASASAAMGALQQTTRTVPVVFVSIIDPVGAGFVESLAHPGGNVTGFALYEYTLSGKWLELLKEIAPGVTRAAVLRDPTVGSGTGQYAIIQAVAQVVGGGVASDGCARSWRDRARHRGVRAGAEWWSDRCWGSFVADSSPSGHHACSTPPIAHDLSFHVLHSQRRPTLLWT
jgi:putative ABC transport system substrate-binding protein